MDTCSFIVVGGGSAGSVGAARLPEISINRVLLIKRPSRQHSLDPSPSDVFQSAGGFAGTMGSGKRHIQVHLIPVLRGGEATGTAQHISIKPCIRSRVAATRTARVCFIPICLTILLIWTRWCAISNPA